MISGDYKFNDRARVILYIKNYTHPLQSDSMTSLSPGQNALETFSALESLKINSYHWNLCTEVSVDCVQGMKFLQKSSQLGRKRLIIPSHWLKQEGIKLHLPTTLFFIRKRFKANTIPIFFKACSIQEQHEHVTIKAAFVNVPKTPPAPGTQ